MYQTVSKVSLQYVKFPESLEGFQTVWKVSGESGKFLKSPESFRTVWKVSRQSEQFLNSLKDLPQKKTASYSVLCYIIICLENRVDSFSVCRETNLRTFGTNVAKTIYALCPESFCA